MENYYRPPNPVLCTVGLALATFMQVLDTTIANVSLPTIAGNMGVSVDQSTWVITSFAVSQAIGLPLTGFLARRFGEIKVFTWCTLLFVLASFLCGIAQSMEELILFRVLQGAVCGPMYPVTQSLMIAIYPPMKRGMALSLISMVTVVAPVVGPILGGWITDSYSWRWIFFINIPIGIFCSFVVREQLRGKIENIEKPRMDYIGLITLIIGVGLLQVVLDKGNDADWFSSPFIITASIISAVALLVFIVWELTHDDPIVNLKLFRHHNFLWGTVSLVLGFACFFGIALLIPLWLQRNLGYTAVWSGLATAPVGIFPLLTVYFIGKYAGKIDLRWLTSVAFLVMGSICLYYSQFDLEVNFATVAMSQFMLGIGIAFFFMPVLTILLSDLHINEIAAGSGLATFLRTIGGSFAVSIITLLWTDRAAVHHAQLTESITPYNPIAQQALNTFGPDNQSKALEYINGVITQQGFQIAFNEVFYALAMIFFVLVALMWMARPPFISAAVPPAKPNDKDTLDSDTIISNVTSVH